MEESEEEMARPLPDVVQDDFPRLRNVSTSNGHQTFSEKYPSGDFNMKTTPPEYKIKVRKRASRLNQSILSSLPGSPIYNRAVKRHLYRSMQNDLKRQQPAVNLCPRCDEREEYLNQGLLHSVMKMTKFKYSKQISKLNEESVAFARVNISRFCKSFNLPRKFVARLVKGRERNNHKRLHPNESRKKIEQRDMDAMHHFFMREDISNEVPNRKHHKKRFLKRTLWETYKIYENEMSAAGKRVFGFSTFHSRRPKCIKLLIQLPDQGCACQSCVNSSLKIRSLRSNGVSGVSSKLTTNVIHTLCKPPGHSEEQTLDNNDILQYDIHCIHRKCNSCGVFQLENMIRNSNQELFEENKELHFMVWERVMMQRKGKESKKLCRVKKKSTVAAATELFCQDIYQMSTHLFNFRFQHQEFERCKQSLMEGDILLVCDFATNFSHMEHEEPQGAHWNRPQTTVHPMVCYFKCPTCNTHLVTDEIFIASDDLQHDFHAVAAFENKMEEHLEDNNISVKRIFRFSDNCAAQYKSKNVMDWLSRKQKPYQANYFCSKHGKGPSDGLAGRCTQLLARGKKNGKALLVEDADTMIAFFQEEMGTFGSSQDGKCSHKWRHFFAVNQIPREMKTDSASPVFGTQKIHCVRNVGVPGIVEVRMNSCFCDSCSGHSLDECENHRHVDKFLRVNIYGNNQTVRHFGTLSNNIWGDHMVDRSRDWCPAKKRKVNGPKLSQQKNKKICSGGAQTLNGQASHLLSIQQAQRSCSSHGQEYLPIASTALSQNDSKVRGKAVHDIISEGTSLSENTVQLKNETFHERTKNADETTTSLIQSPEKTAEIDMSFPVMNHDNDCNLPDTEYGAAPVNNTSDPIEPNKQNVLEPNSMKDRKQQSEDDPESWEHKIDTTNLGRRTQPLRLVALGKKLCRPCSVVLTPLDQDDLKAGSCVVWSEEDMLPLAHFISKNTTENTKCISVGSKVSILRKSHSCHGPEDDQPGQLGATSEIHMLSQDNSKTAPSQQNGQFTCFPNNACQSEANERRDFSISSSMTHMIEKTTPSMNLSEEESDGSDFEDNSIASHFSARTWPYEKGSARTRLYKGISGIMQVDGASDAGQVPWNLRSAGKSSTTPLELVIRGSPGKGLGVFAGTNIERHAIVCEYEGKLICEEDLPQKPSKNFPPKVEEWTSGTGNFAFFFQTLDGKVWCIDAENFFSYGARVNHSINGCNLVPFVCEKVKGHPRLLFKAKRFIHNGEELLYDYGEREDSVVASFPWLQW